jgi:hypothetical protein
MNLNVTIYQAEAEGYVVVNDPGFGDDVNIAFAGDLAACLDYVASYFEPADDEDDSDDLGLE